MDKLREVVIASVSLDIFFLSFFLSSSSSLLRRGFELSTARGGRRGGGVGELGSGAGIGEGGGELRDALVVLGWEG